MFLDITKVRVRLRELEACVPEDSLVESSSSTKIELTRQGSRDLAHILEVRPEVFTPRTGSCKHAASAISLPSSMEFEVALSFTYFSRGS